MSSNFYSKLYQLNNEELSLEQYQAMLLNCDIKTKPRKNQCFVVPLEGRTYKIIIDTNPEASNPHSFFISIDTGSKKLQAISCYIFNNAEYFEGELKRIKKTMDDTDIVAIDGLSLYEFLEDKNSTPTAERVQTTTDLFLKIAKTNTKKFTESWIETQWRDAKQIFRALIS